MARLSKNQTIMLIAAFAVLAVGDWMAATSIDRIFASARLSGEKAESLKRHIRVCGAAGEIADSAVDAANYIVPASQSKEDFFRNRLKEFGEKLQADLKVLTEADAPGVSEETKKLRELATNVVESSSGIKQLLSDPKTATDETFQRNLFKSLRKGADDLHNEIQAIRKADIVFLDSFGEANKRLTNAPLLFFLFAFTNSVLAFMFCWRVAQKPKTEA